MNKQHLRNKFELRKDIENRKGRFCFEMFVFAANKNHLMVSVNIN